MSSFLQNAAMSAAQAAQVLHLSMRKLPSSPDGLSDAQAAPAIEGKEDKDAWLMRVVKGVSGQVKRGNPLPPSALPSLLDAITHAKNTGIDDRKLLLEHVLTLMSRLPPSPPPAYSSGEAHLQKTIENAVIGLFYDALPHPPTNFMPSMMIEMKVPTVIGETRVGAGGKVGVSEAGIGNIRVVAGGEEEPDLLVGGKAKATPWNPTIGDPILERARPLKPQDTHQQTPTPVSSRFASSSPTASSPESTSNGRPTPGQQSSQQSIPQLAYSSAFRVPSGAGNNPHMPLLGAAGTAYARSVVPMHPIPLSAQPDPDMVFDILMKRRDPPKEMATDPEVAAEFRGQGHGLPHPSGLSTMLFAFGDLIIHTLFRTSARDQGVNLTSSYLDLSVLYGIDEKEMQGVRRYDGTGRLWEDCWADPRIAMMSPAVGALLIIFCRNHNYIALRLLDIDEHKTYEHPVKAPTNCNATTAADLFPWVVLGNDTEKRALSEKLMKQDTDIFNRARLINCAFFMNAILGDYLSGILGTFRDASEWYLNPLEEIRKGGKTIVKRAEGNCVSVEFNILYRWHATLTKQDEAWLETSLKKALPGHPIQAMESGKVTLTKADLVTAAMNAGRLQGADPKAWTIGGLKRTQQGGFHDHELAKILHTATDTVACAYGARGIPEVMRVIETAGMEQARKWGVCTFNEFRQFVGLKKYESFKEWNPTGDIAEAAARLYGHIDNLELYPGLMCEESKQAGDGAGLCPGYTISRAILADAVCLTRGDRFLTTDLSPVNLTSWGFQDCARDVKNGSMGGMISKLLFRNLPDYYPADSVYGHFPFVTPPSMETWLTKMNLVDRYSFKKLSSDPIRPVVPINSAAGVSRVLKDMTGFKTVYSDAMNYLTNGYGFFLAFDDEPRHKDARAMMAKAIYRNGAMDHYADFYRAHTRELIKLRSFETTGPNKRAVNIVRDVINIVPVHWVCEDIGGIPLKSEKAPKGIFTEQEVYGMIACIFTFIFLNLEPEHDWPLRENSAKFAPILIDFFKSRLLKLSGSRSIFSFQGLRDSLLHFMTEEVDNSDPFYKAILANNTSNLSIDELAYNVFGVVGASVANFAMAASIVVDFYLSDERAHERDDIKALSMDNTTAASDRLAGYAREALRLSPQAPGLFRKATADVTVEEGNGLPPVQVQKGDRIFVSLAKANMDPDIFPEPTKIDPTRPKAGYSSFGRGEHQCLGDMFTDRMIPSMLRSIFSLKNIRRAKGAPGKLARFKHAIFGTESYLYISAKGTVTPWPSSLLIEYDL